MAQGFFEKIVQDCLVQQATERGLTPEAYAEHLRRENAAQDAKAARDREESALAEKAIRDKRMQEEAAYRLGFGEGLGLPGPAHLGHIIRLAGLSARSNGDGRLRNTVTHVVINAPMQIGRRSRKAGDLLCRPASTVGRRQSLDITGTGQWHRDDILDTGWHNEQVSCAACQAIIDQLKSNPKKGQR